VVVVVAVVTVDVPRVVIPLEVIVVLPVTYAVIVAVGTGPLSRQEQPLLSAAALEHGEAKAGGETSAVARLFRPFGALVEVMVDVILA